MGTHMYTDTNTTDFVIFKIGPIDILSWEKVDRSLDPHLNAQPLPPIYTCCQLYAILFQMHMIQEGAGVVQTVETGLEGASMQL